MKCPKCGCENKEDSRFCKDCGAILNIGSSENSIKPKNNKNILIIIGTAILCFIIIAGALSILENDSNNEVVNYTNNSTDNNSSAKVSDNLSTESVDKDRYAEFDKSEWYLPSYTLEDIYTAHTPDDVKAQMFEKADANDDGILVGDEIKEMDYLLKHNAYTWQGPGKGIHNVTISTSKGASEKTACSVYVGSGSAGETVQLSVLYSYKGTNLNNGNIVPVEVETNGYATVFTEKPLERYPDQAYISLYDKDGELLDTKNITLKTTSGSQSF